MCALVDITDTAAAVTVIQFQVDDTLLLAAVRGLMDADRDDSIP